MRYIHELKSGDMVSDIYLCKSKQTLKTKAGKSYYSMMLQDKTGTVDAKVWELTPGIEYFEPMDFIKVEGQVTSFQGSLQLNLRRIRRAKEGEYIPADYMPCSRYSIEDMYKELMGYVDSVKEPHLHELLELFFVKNTAFIKSFKEHSAAKSIHHGFVGGLLEHTLSVVKMCRYFADTYEILNRDLLYTAAMCHDIGKTKELSAFPDNDYTDDGQLLGHIIIGVEMMNDAIREIPGFPEKLGSELKHCIISHHGELEYGSPKKPALAEAMALNLADNADAKMQTLTEIFKNKPGNDWLGYNRMFETNLRRSSI